ncbi:glycine--tRNA ligase [Candidatus Marsarchaeota G2 archaeon OSP_D]|uniref:glycine--tRNA ligase n=5 Tax=Candidatus Marsarchaeota group 2 TaxID=2203771 RepID=A0A2R6CA54_9ARCH|nr:MAG: glycine--tRNA ligase [Candidatus Marsarchaeota G2 archaeon ECH_B_SAG-M15]PSN92647.1 MAG: glycine--tRNA ligase [Candidatus Marsarchaeota G2 archaeon OSP_D]PSN96748.1 MAG: glycine--tRNA ligase [Candidatus Marsarchaeota G2 archaeon ECH_B_2]PSO03450.1 MAG: glycine--tRNA ligase [Candidatus Marsarchaeota G2 archaeon ECH_B_1]PSO07761.1 MAG: glycine--tRNA ligase [Candidatus Marsarchaeota G2 archaeon BE_D]
MSSKYEKITDLAKRRGLYMQSAEIYGGVAGFIDYGPIGAQIKSNIVDLWKKIFVESHPDLVYLVETPIITPEQVFKASGHVDHFTDPVVECSKCGRIYRADHLLDELGVKIENLDNKDLFEYFKRGVKCPFCGGTLGQPYSFNLLFKTTIGPYASSVGYIRAETAQGMFTMFKRAYEDLREKRVFGLAQIGKVGRNEISPRQGPLRLREFTQMELEFFFDPDDAQNQLLADVENSTLRLLCENHQAVSEVKVQDAIHTNIVCNQWLAYFMVLGQRFIESLGFPPESYHFLEVPKLKLPHYSKQTWDLMVKVDKWGWVEVAGYSFRGDFDLSAHSKLSGVDLRVFKPLEKPIVKKRLRFKWDVNKLRSIYAEKTGLIIARIKSLDDDEVRVALESGFLEVDGIKIAVSDLGVEEVTEEEKGIKYFPNVVEPSFGVDRIFYAMLDNSYTEKDGRIVLRLPRSIAYPHVGVLPLIKKDGLDKVARNIFVQLSKAGLKVTYDDDGSIGRRYSRLDEIGVPASITVDHQTLEDNSVTLRDRDTWLQVRIKMNDLVLSLKKFIFENAEIYTLGEPFTAGQNERIKAE